MNRFSLFRILDETLVFLIRFLLAVEITVIMYGYWERNKVLKNQDLQMSFIKHI